MTGAITVSASGNSLQYSWGGTSIGYCYGCNCWPCQCTEKHYHYHQYTPAPSYTYTIASPDKAALLKAWLDGYMTDRKMSEKALATIRKKLEEFVI